VSDSGKIFITHDQTVPSGSDDRERWAGSGRSCRLRRNVKITEIWRHIRGRSGPPWAIRGLSDDPGGRTSVRSTTQRLCASTCKAHKIVFHEPDASGQLSGMTVPPETFCCTFTIRTCLSASLCRRARHH
jgi:hypothetical protein